MTRVISGEAGGLSLEVPKSGTRPTSDKVREALFSLLGHRGYLDGANVLDLYAGSGALGIEAASRGAAKVTLVERSGAAVDVVRRNVAAVRAAMSHDPQIAVVSSAVSAFLGAAVHHSAPYDLVFLDPPYDLPDDDLAANLEALAQPGCLVADALVVVERSGRSPEPVWPAGWLPDPVRRYGETTLWFAGPSR